MKVLNSMLIILTLAIWSGVMAGDRGSPRSLDDCDVDEEITLTPADDYRTFDFYIDDDDGECGRRPGDEHIIQLLVAGSGLYTFDFEYGDSQAWMYLLTGCCDGDQLYPRGLIQDTDYLRCIWLEQGVYYLLIEGEGEYEIAIEPCNHPCQSVVQDDGFTYEGDQIVYVETVNENSDDEHYEGPWLTEGARCQEESANPEGEWVGFGYYNWYNQDFGWRHLFDTEAIDCADYSIDSAFVVICAYENDFCGNEGPAADVARCQVDLVHADQGDGPLGILNWDAYPGNNLSVSESRLWLPTSFLDDGMVDVWLDIDAMSDQCAWATEVWSSKLVVFMSCRQTPPEPEGYDLGDLPSFVDNEPCYPTNAPGSGGPANAIYPEEDRVAWLGECVTHEPFPIMPDADACDDGILFLPTERPNGAWMPGDFVCVDVAITTGPAYIQGTPLFVWGWKDGNLDCDFDDIYETQNPDDSMVMRDCIIPGYPVFPSGPNQTMTQEICFIDPGVLDMGRYDGKFRFRLLSAGGQVRSPEGDLLTCETALTYVDDVLGETEDYTLEDFQLPVELLSFTANGANGRVVLTWRTGTETENDGFEVQRWYGSGWRRAGDLVDGAGTSAGEHTYMFVDNDVTPGSTYRYALVTIDMQGNRMMVAEVESGVEPSDAVVEQFALHQNFPNPFNPTTQITYDLAQAARVSLTVFDLLGREVAGLVNGTQEAGRYTVSFDATSLPSGMYFYRLETPQFTDMKKMMLLK